jgi:transcriptional regulator with GAF, ATPase, and Fis domain
MARELSAEMNIISIAETVYHYVNRLVDTTNFSIALFDEFTNLIEFPIFIEQNLKGSVPSRKPENGLTEHVIRTREPLFLANNVSKKLELMGLQAGRTENTRIPLCWLGVPLLVGNKSIGVMTLQSFETQDLYSEHDKDLMMTVASQVAIAIENARLFKDAQARARREKILREITARIRATNDPEMIAKAAVRELGQALNIPTFIRLGRGKALSSQEVGAGEVKDNNQKTLEGGI